MNQLSFCFDEPEKLRRPTPMVRMQTASGMAAAQYRDGLRPEGYGPFHPWFYLLGGQPLPVGSLKARDIGWMDKVRPALRLEALAKAKAEVRRLEAHYQRLITEGASAQKLMCWERGSFDRRLAWCGSICSAAAHLTAEKGRVQYLAKQAGKFKV